MNASIYIVVFVVLVLLMMTTMLMLLELPHGFQSALFVCYCFSKKSINVRFCKQLQLLLSLSSIR